MNEEKIINPENIKKVKQVFHGLHEYLVNNNFSGYEYDDLLASPLVNFLTFNSLYLKIAAVQVAKRFPWYIRNWVGVKKLKSTKAFAFIIKGYIHYFLSTGDKQYLTFCKSALDWLLENSSANYSGYCWGNDFDFASRAGFFPKGLPTIVWTSHIQEAFDYAYGMFGEDKYKQVVIDVANFIEQDLERSEDDSGICFAYAPRIVSVVHNANLLGAAALLRSWKYSKNEKHYYLAGRALNWSISRINPDGSWFYGEKKMQHWIDNYHTAYNLDCLCKCFEISDGKLLDKNIILKTYKYWMENFFFRDSVPKFYHNQLYPLDIQATAQAIESFSRYSAYDPDALNRGWNVSLWAIDHMRKKNNSFRYRRYQYWKNNLEAIHWGQATMLSALGYLLYHTDKIRSTKSETRNKTE
jgi:hypothetical protein